MAESEEVYLKQCLEKNICPACQQPLKTRMGKSFKDGVFCSLDCYGNWHEKALWQRHQERMKKDK